MRNEKLLQVLMASATVLAASFILPILVAAQVQDSIKAGAIPEHQQIKVLPPGGPAPRTADGHPDFSGVWFPGVTGDGNLNDVGLAGDYTLARHSYDPKKNSEPKPALQPWAAVKLKEMYPTEVDIQLHSPAVNCTPRGLPAMWIWNPYPSW